MVKDNPDLPDDEDCSVTHSCKKCVTPGPISYAGGKDLQVLGCGN